MLFEPGYYSRGVVDRRGPLADAVSLLRIGDQEGFGAAILQQGVVELHGLLRWGAAIEGAADVECGGSDTLGVHDRAALKVASSYVGVVVGEEQRHEMGYVGQQVLGDVVGEGRDRDRRSEARVLCD